MAGPGLQVWCADPPKLKNGMKSLYLVLKNPTKSGLIRPDGIIASVSRNPAGQD
jgi:hypothetical protein